MTMLKYVRVCQKYCMLQHNQLFFTISLKLQIMLIYNSSQDSDIRQIHFSDLEISVRFTYIFLPLFVRTLIFHLYVGCPTSKSFWAASQSSKKEHSIKKNSSISGVVSILYLYINSSVKRNPPKISWSKFRAPDNAILKGKCSDRGDSLPRWHSLIDSILRKLSLLECREWWKTMGEAIPQIITPKPCRFIGDNQHLELQPEADWQPVQLR